MMAVVFIVVLIFLFILGVPVAFSLGLTSVILMFLQWGTIKVAAIPQTLVGGVNTFTILAVPLFLLAGKLMNAGGITDRLFKFARVLVGFLPGSIGHVVVVANIIFAGMSGTAISDATGLGPIALKAMDENGFDKKFACSVIGAASTIGPIIPPSLPMVIYGMMASVSVGALFVGGILPGLVMAVILMVMVAYYGIKTGVKRDPFPKPREFFSALKGGILPTITPFIIIGGIYSGKFTPTEAAAVVVVYSLILSTFVYKQMTWSRLIEILRETVRDTATLGFIIAAATLYGNVIIRAQIPQTVLGIISNTIHSPVALLLILNAFLLLIGCFMETVSAIIILMPLILPLLVSTGINPLHFGIVMVLNLMIGVLTPPFGLVLFVLARISDISIDKLSRALLPWLGALIIALGIITFVPEITLYLPRVMGLIN